MHFNGQCYKAIFGWNLDFHQMEKLKKVSWDACWEMQNNVMLKPKYALKLSITFNGPVLVDFGVEEI